LGLGAAARFAHTAAMIGRVVLSLLTLVSVAACSGAAPADPAEGERTARIELFRNELKQVTTVERDVRLDALERRIAELEGEVGVLKANPERIDLDLLTQRMTALEVRALSAAPAAPAPSSAPARTPPADTRKADADVRAAIQRARPQPKATPTP
jgi:TolA-binding protein